MWSTSLTQPCSPITSLTPKCKLPVFVFKASLKCTMYCRKFHLHHFSQGRQSGTQSQVHSLIAEQVLRSSAYGIQIANPLLHWNPLSRKDLNTNKNNKNYAQQQKRRMIFTVPTLLALINVPTQTPNPPPWVPRQLLYAFINSEALRNSKSNPLCVHKFRIPMKR